MIYKVRDRLKLVLSPTMRQRVSDARFALRMPTSRIRVLPDFMVIGAMRAGTSSLYRYLSMHPSVVGSLRKETRFFSSSYHKGEHWYRCHFPIRQALRVRSAVGGSQILTFEATPDYMFHPHAPARVAKLLPNVKLVVLLRNPVDRAISHYEHMVRHGYETRTFEQALAEESAMVEHERKKMSNDADYDSTPLRRHSYFSKGVYVSQLEMWFRYYPEERFLIIKSEDLFERPAQSYEQVLTFLGLPKWQPAEFRNYSYWGAAVDRTSVHDVTEAVRAKLAGRYRAHNQRLYDLLDRDFGWDGSSR